jgi:hypothetical protein
VGKVVRRYWLGRRKIPICGVVLVTRYVSMYVGAEARTTTKAAYFRRPCSDAWAPRRNLLQGPDHNSHETTPDHLPCATSTKS